MNELIRNAIAVCEERGIDAGVILWPREHLDHASCVRRANALRALQEKGYDQTSILKVCPISGRMLRQILHVAKL